MQNDNKTALLGIIAVLALVVCIALWYIHAPKQSNDNKNTLGAPTTQVTQKTKSNHVFWDGLDRKVSAVKYNTDETGTGITNVDVFNADINSDGLMDKITKTHHENATAHFWDEYKIELNNNGIWQNITPKGLRTTQGAECALQKIKFVFSPVFQVIKISRPWTDSWATPSMATKTVYELKNGKLQAVSTQKLKSVCDVTELFTE